MSPRSVINYHSHATATSIGTSYHFLLPASGCEAFMEFIRDGHVVGFERITSPINNNPNQPKTIRLVREHNPTLASRLPGPA